MKKQKKQNILTFVIVILVLILVALIISIIYEEKINMSKQNAQQVLSPEINKDVEEDDEVEKIPDEEENEDNEEQLKPEEIIENEDTEYVGEEEKQPVVENVQKSKDEKAIELAQNEWGKDDTVSFNIEEKKGDIYYVAVKSDAVVIQWYEVDTLTWEISEYY